MRFREMEERKEQREDYVILYRYRVCVNNMIRAKQRGEQYTTDLLRIFDIPSESCEYTEEQWDRILELKKELFALADVLSLSGNGD